MGEYGECFKIKFCKTLEMPLLSNNIPSHSMTLHFHYLIMSFGVSLLPENETFVPFEEEKSKTKNGKKKNRSRT